MALACVLEDRRLMRATKDRSRQTWTSAARHEPSNGLGFLIVRQRQRHDGQHGRREPGINLPRIRGQGSHIAPAFRLRSVIGFQRFGETLAEMPSLASVTLDRPTLCRTLVSCVRDAEVEGSSRFVCIFEAWSETPSDKVFSLVV